MRHQDRFVGLKIGRTQKEWLAGEAARREMGMSELVREALRDWIARQIRRQAKERRQCVKNES